MREAFLKRAIKKHFKALGYVVEIRRIRLGNAEIDGETISTNGKRVAVEIKSQNDDIVRGLGQLTEAMVFGYTQCVLVTTLKRARRIDKVVFQYFNWVLLGVDGKGEIHEITS